MVSQSFSMPLPTSRPCQRFAQTRHAMLYSLHVHTQPARPTLRGCASGRLPQRTSSVMPRMARYSARLRGQRGIIQEVATQLWAGWRCADAALGRSHRHNNQCEVQPREPRPGAPTWCAPGRCPPAAWWAPPACLQSHCTWHLVSRRAGQATRGCMQTMKASRQHDNSTSAADTRPCRAHLLPWPAMPSCAAAHPGMQWPRLPQRKCLQRIGWQHGDSKGR